MEDLLCISLFNLENYPKSVLSLAPFSQMKKLNLSHRKICPKSQNHKYQSKLQTKADFRVQPLNHPDFGMLPVPPNFFCHWLGHFLFFHPVLFSVNEMSPLYRNTAVVSQLTEWQQILPLNSFLQIREGWLGHNIQPESTVIKTKRSKVWPENSDGY